MRATVKKWGNSAAVRMPVAVMEEARLEIDQPVDIRVEQGRLADNATDNSLEMPLVTSMYLGDRWEYVFRAADDNPAQGLALRAYGLNSRAPGNHHLMLPDDQVWVFPSL